jgi:uncharacterized protein
MKFRLNIKSFLFIFIGFFLFSSCNKNSSLKKTEITFTKNDNSTVTIVAEIAKTQEERNFGYMKRKVINDGNGMIFVFEKDQILSFWMKDTPHPLSIAYIDHNGIIRDIFDMKPYSLSSIVSNSSVRYAIEVPQGWYERNNIKIGDKIDYIDK